MPTDLKIQQQRLVKKDWLLLVIDAAKPNPLTPLQLQKALFLLGQNIPKVVGRDFYNFIPHNYGPFSKDIYDDVEALKSQDLIDEIIKDGQNWPEYRISQTGAEKAKELGGVLPQNAKAYLDTLVKWVESQSFQTLLHTVYKAYPQFATKSVFNG